MIAATPCFYPLTLGFTFSTFLQGTTGTKKMRNGFIYLFIFLKRFIYLKDLDTSSTCSFTLQWPQWQGLGQTEARSLELQLGLLCECKDLGALAISYFPGALEGLKVEQRGLELTLPHGICWWRCSHSAITSPGDSLALHQSSPLPPEQSPPTRGAGLELLQEGLPSCPSLVAVTCTVS